MTPSSDTPLPSADGRAEVAARIRELAHAHGMAVRQDVDLAALLAAIQVSDPIPIAAFAVVADVLFSILTANQHRAVDTESTT